LKSPPALSAEFKGYARQPAPLFGGDDRRDLRTGCPVGAARRALAPDSHHHPGEALSRQDQAGHVILIIGDQQDEAGDSEQDAFPMQQLSEQITFERGAIRIAPTQAAEI